MKITIPSRAIMLTNSGNVTMNVSKIIRRLLACLINLITLIIRKDLKTDIAVPTDVNKFNYSKRVVMRVSTTTVKSNLLYLSVKYALPKPTTLIIISIPNTARKNRLA